MLKRAVDALPVVWVLEEGASAPGDELADAYLSRPLTVPTLLAQVRALLPEVEVESGVLCVNGFAFDVEQREVRRGGDRRRLTLKQARLLETLMRQPGKTLSRRFLMKHIWNTDYLGDTRTLDVHVRWVREAIEDDPSNPRYLRTVRGVGYRFEGAAGEAEAR